jgi:diguanylate cyclase
MRTLATSYCETTALDRLADDGCPNHGETVAEQNGFGNPSRLGHLLRLARQVRELKKALRLNRRLVREAERLARTDPLTGLWNRRAIEEFATAEIRRRERYGGPLALALSDIDEFKAINNAFLLPGGDRALVGTARALTAALRQTDRLGRFGGDEFLVVAPQTDAEGAAALAGRIRAEVCAATVTYDGRVIRPTVSIGFTVAGAGVAVDLGRLLHVAAGALRQAKVGGRNACVIRPVPREPQEARVCDRLRV